MHVCFSNHFRSRLLRKVGIAYLPQKDQSKPTEINGLLFWIGSGMLIAVKIPAYLILPIETASGPKTLQKEKSQEKCVVEQVSKRGLTLSPLILTDKEKPQDHSSRLNTDIGLIYP